MRFEPGALARTVQRIESLTASLPDVGDTNAPLSSALAFLAEELGSSKYLESFLRTSLSSEAAARLPGLLRQFRLRDILAPLDRLVEGTNTVAGNQEDFKIPEEQGSGEATAGKVVAAVTGWFLRHSDDLFEARSWAWTLLREACFTLQGKGKYTEETLTGIYESSETGPFGYLVVAEVLGHFQPPLARKFAARGLERLSAEEFRRDYRLFLEGNSISSQCSQRLATALRALDAEQIASLAKQQSPAGGEFILEGSRRLRAAKDQPVLETLAPALETYWEQELKGQVAAALKALAFDPEEAFKKGLVAYQTASPDKSEAAKLFSQAAALGHPGAQDYLAMIYERGAGVPRDLGTALNWYRQSATNGYAEAAVVLGNYYHNGLEVRQDYAEAFVWYSVAAAEGDRLAAAFLNSVRRKLTAGQLEEAGKRVATIVAGLPNVKENRAPSDGSDP